MKLTSLLKKLAGTKDKNLNIPEVRPAQEKYSEEGYPLDMPAPEVTGPEVQSSALDSFINEIPPVGNSLEQFIEGSESDFMLLGIGLRTVHSNITELTELMLGTVEKMSSDEEGGFLDRGRQILSASLTEIQAYQDEVKADLDRINTVMNKLEDLYHISKQIKKFSKSLKTVALTMLVENARTIDSSVNIFADVALEVKELSVNIGEIANDVYNNVEKARGILRVTREEISSGITRLETLTEQVQVTVRESTGDTETLMQFSVDTIEQAGRRSRDISRQVAEIVVGVQFHDNMKQRIMHIASILKTMVETAAPSPEPRSNQNPAGIPAGPVLREQAQRLEEMTTEVDYVYQKNRTALKTIGTEVEDLLQSLRGMTSVERSGGSQTILHDPFLHLKEALSQLHQLMDRGKSLYEQIQAAADQVTGITANLTELLNIVRGISAQTHNKAINSIIASDREGKKGGSLKLLAQEMNKLASQSDIFSSQVEGIITGIIDITGHIGQKSLDNQADTARDDSAISRLNEVLHDISLGYEDFRKNSRAAYERASDLKRAIDTTLHSLDFFQGLALGLQQNERHLTDIDQQTAADEILVKVDPTSTHLPGKYTTDQQDNVILFEDARQQNDRNNPHQEFDKDHLGDNVELF
ncbi:MAG: hypothetical protein R6U29_00475 [Desulfosudaceae bacterium]